MIKDSSLSVQLYLSEVEKTTLLSGNDEVELGKRVRAGDERAVEKLIKSNLRFVLLIAKQYEGRGLPLSDLISEGNLGLIKAAQRFDETKGFKFITYAVWGIKQSIQDALEKQVDVVRVPAHYHRAKLRFEKVHSKMQQKVGGEPSLDEITQELNIESVDLTTVINRSKNAIYIDRPIGDDGARMIEFIENDASESPESNLLKQSLKNDIEHLLSTLKPKQKLVLRLLFGFETGMPMSLREIGKRLKISAERVRQIKEEALKRLRGRKNCEVLKAYVG